MPRILAEGLKLEHPLIIIDGHCALCSRGMAWLMWVDRKAVLRITTVQSKTGRALYAGLGKDPDAYDTYTLLADGRPYFKSDGYIETMRRLGGLWRIFVIFKIIPRKLRDALYDWLDRHRIKWFGRTEYCALIPQKYRARIIE